MGAMTLITELLSLICAALNLIVGVILIGLWAMSRLFSSRWKITSFIVCGSLVGVNAIFGFATWIVLTINRANIHDPLTSSSTVVLGRVRIIAAGFACWVFVLLTQVTS